MCGISGIFWRDGSDVDPGVLTRMTRTLAHRGPDGEGFWREGSIGLGHRRLAIRDLGPMGAQPMADAAGRVVVSFNGELYNDRALRRELEAHHGARFRSHSDTEVIPYGYLAWGAGVFERLEGIFAIALWDRMQRVLWLARDAIGTKPLFYEATAARMLFASEPKAIFAARNGAPEFDAGAVHTFLATGHAGPARSVFSGLAQVAPGTILRCDSRSIREQRFWSPSRSGEVTRHSDAMLRLSDTIGEVVGSQLVSDVPVAILQSGGIDSTIVSLAAAREAGRAGERQPTLFTASFSEHSHDESALAASIARQLGSEHRLVMIDEGGDVRGDVLRSIYHCDGGLADTGTLGLYRLSRAVSREFAAVLSGDGGDEFFAGYETYAATRTAVRLGPFVPRPALRTVGRLLYALSPRSEERLPPSALAARFLLALGDRGRIAHTRWRRLVQPFLLPMLYGSALTDYADVSPYAEYDALYESAPGEALDKALLADQQFHLQSVLAKTDLMSMAHGLEVRVPLLDRRMMNLAGRIHIDLMNPPGGPAKKVLRDLAYLLGAPRAVVTARKRGFNVPIARLLRRGLRETCETLFARQPDVLAPFCRPDGLRRLWAEHRDGVRDHAFAIWPLLTLAAYRSGLAAEAAKTADVRLRPPLECVT